MTASTTSHRKSFRHDTHLSARPGAFAAGGFFLFAKGTQHLLPAVVRNVARCSHSSHLRRLSSVCCLHSPPPLAVCAASPPFAACAVLHRSPARIAARMCCPQHAGKRVLPLRRVSLTVLTGFSQRVNAKRKLPASVMPHTAKSSHKRFKSPRYPARSTIFRIRFKRIANARKIAPAMSRCRKLPRLFLFSCK